MYKLVHTYINITLKFVLPENCFAVVTVNVGRAGAASMDVIQVQTLQYYYKYRSLCCTVGS